MKLITAKILDPTHLELNQPINGKQGETITISIADETEDQILWKVASKKKFLSAYSEEDAIYDNL